MGLTRRAVAPGRGRALVWHDGGLGATPGLLPVREGPLCCAPSMDLPPLPAPRPLGRRAAGLLLLGAAGCAPDGEHHPALSQPPPDGVLADRLRLVFGAVPASATAEALGREAALAGWRGGGDAVMWLGHAGVMLRLGGTVAVVDPVFGERASPLPGLGPRRLVALPFDAESLPPFDALLLTHDHYDHLELSSFRALARRPGVACLLPRRVAALRGIACARTEELGWGESRSVGALTATFLPARHESGRGLFDHRVTLWGAWALEGGGRRVYVAGDTAHGPHFAEAGARHGPFDLAIMGVGGFLPRRTNHHQHASPEEVIQGFRELRASRLMLVHWGTYPMGAEDTGAAPAATLAAARAAGLPETAVIVPRIGESLPL